MPERRLRAVDLDDERRVGCVRREGPLRIEPDHPGDDAFEIAAVDIWHCDASGIYSGFGAGRASRTFMRGIQRTNANGVATFKTVYPGWYQGRTVHIHVKVHVRGNVVHTGQLYFPDRVTDAAYGKAPYTNRPNRDVRNADDMVFRNGGKRSLLSVRRNDAGYLGSIRMGVRRS